MSYLHRVRIAALVSLSLVATACPGGKRHPADSGVVDAGDAGAACVGASCPWEPCQAAGCTAHQLCTASASGPVCVRGTCEPGFTFVASSGECTLDPTGTCGGATSSITDACGALHRSCDATGGAHCGDCKAGFDPTASACSASEACQLLGCAGQQRECPSGGASTCGACAVGYVEGSSGACIPTSCGTCDAAHRTCSTSGGSAQCGACSSAYIENANHECETLIACSTLDCAAQHRTCSMSPNGHCENACVAGWVWDVGTGSCRAPITCGALGCAAMGKICIPESGSMDATCSASCPNGSGWDYAANGALGGCVTCGSGVQSGSTCAMFEGATGRVIAEGHTNGSTCFCETQPGYFPSVGNIPEPCDVDADGWIREGAADAYLSPPTRDNRKTNARCDLRTISSVRVRNEDGSERVAESFQSPVPLYEATENDFDPPDPSSSTFAPYGHYTSTLLARPIPAVSRNSLTKACVHQSGDYNRNGLRDVEESQLETPEPGNTVLISYFAAYTRNSYFIELHDGWFVPNSSNAQDPGTYLVVERNRSMGSAERRVAMRPGLGVDDYWQVCDRHVDRIFQSASVTTRSGGDFSASCNGPTCSAEMAHHSQFKCMVVSSDALAYTAVNASATSTPWRGYWWSGSDRVEWMEGANDFHVVGVPNVCLEEATSPAAEPSAAPVNPKFLDFDCSSTDLDANPPPTGLGDAPAHWVAVDYTNAAQTSAAEYRRGCINECAERGPTACPGYAVSQSKGFDCYEGVTDRFGELQCGCRTNYLGTNCEAACSSDFQELFTSGSANDGTPHLGDWMCMRPVASDGTLLTGGGFELRGAIQSMATDGTPLIGAQYTVRAITDGRRGGP